jgi:hypothetical protein
MEGQLMEGRTAAPDQPAAADDPQMVELRAFAAEVVRAAGGVPGGAGYRPRLEPRRRTLTAAPVELLGALGWQIGSTVRRRPARTLAFTIAGVGVVVGALWLRSALAPADASLELATAPRILVAAAPAPPPPVIALPDEPVRTSPPPVAPSRSPVEAVSAPRVARSAIPKRALLPPVKPTKRSGLDRATLIDGMRAVQPRVNDCYREYHQKGVANLRIEVGRGGRVNRVLVSGPLARTPTAGCVKAAVKTAHFRAGGSSFQYPVVLQ